MIKEIKYGSYSAIPSDYECTDGDLAVAIGAVSEDGAVRPVEPPTALFKLSIGKKVLAIHETTQFKHYIVHDTALNKLYWLDSADATNDGTGTADGKLKWLRNITSTINGLTCVGNTVVVVMKAEMAYFFWRDGSYHDLGAKPPFTTIQFGLRGQFESYPNDEYALEKPDGYGKYEDVDETGIRRGWIIWNTSFYRNSFPCSYNGYEYRTPYTGGSFSAEDMYTIASASDFDDADASEDNSENTAGVVNSLTNLILGAMNKFLAVKGTDKDRFIMPFLVRYAYRMFDGSHIMHSVPVLLIPNSKAPVCWWRNDSSIQGEHKSSATYAKRQPMIYSRISAFTAKLVKRMVAVPSALYDWKDVITGIDIFVSAPLYNYDQSGHVFGWERMTPDDSTVIDPNLYGDYFHVGCWPQINGALSGTTSTTYARYGFYDLHQKKYNQAYCAPRYRFLIPEFEQAEINKKVEECSLFYKVSTIDFDELVWKDGDSVKTATKPAIADIDEVDIEEGTLKALTSRERLQDDYKTHYPKTADTIYSYNSRLNLGHVYETIDSEANHPLAMFPIHHLGTPPYYWHAVVEYNKDGKRYYSEQRSAPGLLAGQDCDYPMYIFVPDTDAKRVYLTRWRGSVDSSGNEALSDKDTSSLIGGGDSDTDSLPVDTTVTEESTAALAASADATETAEAATSTDKDTDGNIVIPTIDDAKQDGGVTDDKDYGITDKGWQTSDGATTRLNTGVYVIELKEHENLNGAIWFKGYGTGLLSTSSVASLTKTSNMVEYRSKIYTTDVNNPFYFPLSGINTVGTGSVLGIVTAAKALSQGQFGQFPLYSLTDEGVWALEITSTGSYSAKQPISRDVCINPASITQLDSSVLFASDRGLMMIEGSTLYCISDGLNSSNPYDVSTLPGIGALVDLYNSKASSTEQITKTDLQVDPFMDFLKGCGIVYDYTHQRVIVYDKRRSYAYVYSLKSKNWGMLRSHVADTINSYPEALAQQGDGTVINFSSTDASKYAALLVTRPLKLDGPDVLKTIDTVIQRGYVKMKNVAQVLYGSRDLYNWHTVWSSTDGYLRGFSGEPYKYFRLALVCSFDKDDSLYGCSVSLKARDNNQLR